MGAGILPISIHNSNIFFLFGKDAKNNLWSDFGGKSESSETTYQTAIREGAEELNGFLGSGNKLSTIVNSNKLLTIHYHKYTIYVFLTNYDTNLPLYYNNNYDYLNVKLSPIIKPSPTLKHTGLLEKKEIRWFSYNDIIVEHNNFRQFYRPILDIIIKEYPNILGNIKKLKS